MTVNILKTVKNKFPNKHCYRVQYIVVSVVIVLFMNFRIEGNESFCLWNTERILISESPKIVSDKSKYFLYIGNLENQCCWFGTQKVKLHLNKDPTFLLLYTITNEKTV